MRKIIATLVVMLLVAPAEGFAQNSMMSVCEDCIGRVSVPVPPVGLLRDAVAREATRRATSLAVASQQQTQPHARNWAGRHPVLLGTLIGTGSGFGLGAAGCGLGDDKDLSALWVECGAIGGVFGAGLGAAVGVVDSVLRR